MNRFKYMTVGLLLVFVGAQLYFVETYVLTPQVTKIVGKKLGDPSSGLGSDANNSYNSSNNYYQNYSTAGFTQNAATDDPFAPRKELSPPRWICWPVFFLGAVFFLHALALPSGGFSKS